MNLYPRSFLRLIVLGNILAVLPLLAAVGYASLTVDDLAGRSEVTVREASRAATSRAAMDSTAASRSAPWSGARSVSNMCTTLTGRSDSEPDGDRCIAATARGPVWSPPPHLR